MSLSLEARRPGLDRPPRESGGKAFRPPAEPAPTLHGLTVWCRQDPAVRAGLRHGLVSEACRVGHAHVVNECPARW